MAVELIMCALGLFLSYWVNYGFGTNDTKAAFEFPIYFQIVFAGVTLLLVPGLPESPRWLVSQGKSDKALEALVRVGDNDDTADSAATQMKIREMEEMIMLEEVDGIAWFKSLVSITELVK